MDSLSGAYQCFAIARSSLRMCDERPVHAFEASSLALIKDLLIEQISMKLLIALNYLWYSWSRTLTLTPGQQCSFRAHYGGSTSRLPFGDQTAQPRP
jgi:hypothetical protein